jgi:hypothetical protein
LKLSRFIAILAAAACWVCTSPASAETASALSLADPAVFSAQLREMGYDLEPFETGQVPTTIIRQGSDVYSMALGGCTASRNCKYLVLISSFSDISNPPADWVAKHNADYDMIKVWVNDDHHLTYSIAMVVDGMPRSTFRANVDLFTDSGNSLAREAVIGGLSSDSQAAAH